jgi:hypothetical protein
MKKRSLLHGVESKSRDWPPANFTTQGDAQGRTA